MKHELPQLPYSYDALEPHIDAQTMEIHHSKHHQGYVDKLNAALKGNAELQGKSLEELISSIESITGDVHTAIRNNGGGHYNHSLFWKIMGSGGDEPTGELAEAIMKAFGDFGGFKEEFTKVASTRFGSGWAWLLVNRAGELEVASTPNQDSPLMDGQKPILGLDVWEHAYYLKYQNKRPDYIEAWWSVVNWEEVGKNFSS
jgi:superoxide dismutase, Fe-Mn family